jgi:predicted alpha/beta hydrolase
VLEPFLGKSRYANHGQRVVEGQRLMQAASDIMLGWDRITSPDGFKWDFYMRQLWDNKGSAIIEGMKPRELAGYAEICGRTLARAHARSGDAVMIGAYLGSGDAMDQAVADFAELYADQNELDYAALDAAIKTGKVNAEPGL